MKAIFTLCFLILFLSSVKANLCTVQLIDRDGSTAQTFMGTDMTAHECIDAMEDCKDFLNWEVKFKKGMSCIDAYGNTSDSVTMDMELELDSDIL